MDLLISSSKAFRCGCSVALKVWNGFATMATDSKLPKILKKIGTHNGVFHCDEALACYMLKQLPEYRDAEIVRTRDMSILDTCDVVVDVGGVYNPKTYRFDHHQRGFEDTLTSVRPDLAKKNTIKLSSAGLVYAHYGLDVIEQILQQNDYPIPANCLHNIFLYIYEGFVEELDAIDNGVPMYTEGKPRYRINTNLSARIHRLNPEWNSPQPESTDKLFAEAMNLAGTEFKERVVEVRSKSIHSI
jgi:uncharacterized UPF0160 family protein